MTAFVAADQGRQHRTIAQRYEDAKNLLKDQSSQVRIPEFLLFASLIFGTATPVGLPAHQLVLMLICLYGLSRKPVYSLFPLRGLMVLFGCMLVYIALVSWLADPTDGASDWRRRLFRLGITTLLIFLLASGQLHLRSAIYGYVAAILLNIPLFYAGLVPDTYGGFLTGLVGDKNVAGLVYCLFGIAMLSLVRKKSHRIIVFLVFAGATWLTGSRTSLAAFAMGVLWIILAPRLSGLARAFLGLGIYLLVNILSEDYSQVGDFADRAGSDALRGRIDDAAWERVQETGFFGQGLGEAYVNLSADTSFFFHNSYWSAFVEGGWLWVIFLVALTVFVLIRPFSDRKTWTAQQLIAQGLGIALLICSWRLGEVLFTMYWAICLGFGLRVWLAERPENLAQSNRGLDQELIPLGNKR